MGSGLNSSDIVFTLFTVSFVTLLVIVFFCRFMWGSSHRYSKPKIITFTGPSGAGKTTIVGELLKRHPEWNMIVSLTSREPRKLDLPGEYRCNVSKDEFLLRYQREEFIWLVSVHGNMYGTLLADIARALLRDYSLMQIVPDSVKKLQADVPKSVLSFFILPPGEKELRRRLKERGESEDNINRRIADCKKWEDEAKASGIYYEFVRNDGTVKEVVDKVEEILDYQF